PYDAAVWQAALDELARLSAADAAPWVAYGTSGTILQAATTNPTLGAGTTWSAHYRRQSAVSTMVTVRMQFTIGSGFNAGSGSYRFLLPFQASANAIAGGCGSWYINDSGTQFRTGTVTINSLGIYCELVFDGQTGGPISSAGPGTAWATGDNIRIQLDYEPQ
ncbi:hypothetical protein, partial [Dactylosporangium matsuzakiense]